MKTRIVAVAAGVLALAGGVALTTVGHGSAAVAAPTTADYRYCVASKKGGGTVTGVVRKQVGNNSAPAHTVCGVYLVTGV